MDNIKRGKHYKYITETDIILDIFDQQCIYIF